MRKQLATLAFILTACASQALSASVICTHTETIDHCISRESTAAIAINSAKQNRDAPRKIAANALDKIKAIPTGVLVDDLTSTVTDTLPIFSITGIDAAGADNTANTAINWAPRLLTDEDASIGSSLAQIQLDREPGLFPLLTQALRDAGEGGLISGLEDTLDDADDVLLSWHKVSDDKYFSRDILDYQSLIQATIRYANILAAEQRDDDIKSDVFCGSHCLIDKIKANSTVCSETVILHLPISNIKNPECRAFVMALIDEEVQFQIKSYNVIATNLDELGIRHFAELVANNAQLKWGLIHHSRDTLVGADLTAAKVGFEYSTSSLTHFLLTNSRACEKRRDNYKSAEACAKAFASFVKNKSDSDLKGGLRFNLGLEYAQIDANNIHVPIPSRILAGGISDNPLSNLLNGTGILNITDESIDIELPSVERFTLNMGVGWIFMPPRGDGLLKRSGRVDAYGKYKTFSANAIYSEAWSIGLTVSFDVGGITIPIQLVHQGKSEFEALGLNLEDTSIGIGFAYKLLNE
ncbi:MAG: hypothetical protein ACJA1T_000331 [Zhongshania aliphaticivorans]|jgi:hypothetical protein